MYKKTFGYGIKLTRGKNFKAKIKLRFFFLFKLSFLGIISEKLNFEDLEIHAGKEPKSIITETIFVIKLPVKRRENVYVDMDKVKQLNMNRVR